MLSDTHYRDFVCVPSVQMVVYIPAVIGGGCAAIRNYKTSCRRPFIGPANERPLIQTNFVVDFTEKTFCHFGPPSRPAGMALDVCEHACVQLLFRLAAEWLHAVMAFDSFITL